jgi:hypothetical protein
MADLTKGVVLHRLHQLLEQIAARAVVCSVYKGL